MCTLILTLFIAMSSLLAAEDNIRTGAPKDCYLFSFGKGPNWTAKVSTEFRLTLLERQMPCVDEQYSDPTGKALTWTERKIEPTITTIASVNGREIIQVIYPEKGSFGKTIGTILLAIETERGSGWFSLFCAAQPELYRGRIIHGRDVAIGYLATFEFSGTGAFRTHHLFDLRKQHPVLIATLDSGRVVKTEFKSDAEYEQALKIYDEESDLLAGIIHKPKPVKNEH